MDAATPIASRTNMFCSLLHPRILPRAAAIVALCVVGADASACGVAAGTVVAVAANARAEVSLDDGRLVRFAGLDIAAPALARGWLAAHWMGKTVAVALLAPRPDRWGRWLADLSTPDGESAAVDLLLAGFARVRPEFETRGCESERLDAEAGARAAGQGVWNEPDAALDAADLASLRAKEGRFALIEGVVRRVGLSSSRVYLDFGRRDGFTVIVARKLAPAFERLGFVLDALAGRSIRVRGVLEMRLGPRIELSDPLMIEATEARKETKPGG